MDFLSEEYNISIDDIIVFFKLHQYLTQYNIGQKLILNLISEYKQILGIVHSFKTL